MPTYQGDIVSYDLSVQSPNNPTIYLNGSFGLAFLYFVPDGGSLGVNGKRAGQNIFDVYYWMSSWPQIADMLRNEKPVLFFFNTDDNTAVVATGDEPVGEEEIGHQAIATT